MLTPQAKRHLSKSDPIMSRLVKNLDISGYQLRENTFRGLVESIISQQLSTRAARTIRKRFWEVLGTRQYKPQHILNMTHRRLRGSGISGNKIKFIKGLALAASTKKLNFKLIKEMDNEQVIEELTKHKGVGKWTAEMFLIFSLGRMDVFSLGDWGLRNAISKQYKIKNPSDKKILKFAENWKPFRSVACLYLWASLDNQ